MRRKIATIISCLIVQAMIPAVVHAEQAGVDRVAHGPRAFSERFYRLDSVAIRMRDGVKLHTDIIRPKRPGTYPIFMIRTPYGSVSEGFNQPARMQKLAEQGYIFVLQETRGTERSGGTFVMNPPRDRSGKRGAFDESTDTYDTVEWLLKNVKGNNGAVGVAGCSYPGYAAVMAGLSGHPAVKAISPQAPMADMFRGDDFFWNGIPILAQTPFFATEMESRNAKVARVDSSDAYQWYLDVGALKDVQPAISDQPSQIWNTMMQNSSLTEFWQSRVLAKEAPNLKVPSLLVMGWFDGEDFPGPSRLWQALDALDSTGRHRAIIGPWDHCLWNEPGPGNHFGPLVLEDAPSDRFKEIEARFFAHYLKGEGSLDDLPQAMVYETGTGGGWRAFDRWPQSSTAKSLYLAGGEGLTAERPETQTKVSYVSDPAKPVPYARRPIDFFTGQKIVPGDGKARSLFLVEDQRFVQGRPDVMIWMSQPLEQDLVLDGQAALEFFAETSGTDVDWIVQLVDVHPDNFDTTLSGYRLPVSRGALRASLRKDLSKPVAVTPGAIETYTIPLEARRHRFAKGHRILVQLQSSYFPYLARNPQQFIALDKASRDDFRVVTNTIHKGGATPSRLLIPVVAE